MAKDANTLPAARAALGPTAVHPDGWTEQMILRARTRWHAPLAVQGWPLPPYLVGDLGQLLIRPEAQLAPAGVPGAYLAMLREVVADERFWHCSRLIVAAERARQDEAVRTAIQSMTRPVRGWASRPRAGAADGQDWIGRRLSEAVGAGDGASWIGPIDLIAVSAAARLPSGARLLDYRLLDECLSDWHRLPQHRLRCRRVPVRREGEKEVSRRAGDIVGYTGVRPRLPTDDWIDILQYEWGLVRSEPRVGLDKILNRQTLVYSKESPYDLLPQLQVLVMFLIDTDPSVLVAAPPKTPAALRQREAQVRRSSRAKALTYRMILDAAEQVPFEKMTVHVATYVLSFGGAARCRASCFDLRSVPARTDPVRQIVEYDALVPSYFTHSQLRAFRPKPVPGPWPELSEDPYIFLGSAAAASSTYTAVLTVIFSHDQRWPGVFPSGQVPLRPVEVGRPTVLLADPDLAGEGRSCRWCTFANLSDAAIGHVAQFRSGSDLAVRDAFLEMLLGPVAGPDESRPRDALKFY